MINDNTTVLCNPDLLKKVLNPYYPHCHYLQKATVECVKEKDQKQGKLIARGVFSIPESCYIESTGHFNSVEFNICYIPK